MLQRIIMLMLLTVPLVACVEQTPAKETNEVHLSPALTFSIPLYEYNGVPMEVSQLVTASYDEKKFVFEAHLSITPERLRMVGLDPFGRKALTIEWSKQGVTYDAAPWVPLQLHPENILADIVLLYWPEKSVREAIIAAHGTFVAKAHSRSIAVNGKEVIHAEYRAPPDDLWSGSAKYQNRAWGYALDIESVRDK